jgi:hypothetical protein
MHRDFLIGYLRVCEKKRMAAQLLSTPGEQCVAKGRLLMKYKAKLEKMIFLTTLSLVIYFTCCH